MQIVEPRRNFTDVSFSERFCLFSVNDALFGYYQIHNGHHSEHSDASLHFQLEQMFDRAEADETNNVRCVVQISSNIDSVRRVDLPLFTDESVCIDGGWHGIRTDGSEREKARAVLF